MATQKKDVYDEASIRVLKGLEPVRTRPGMYTRTDNPLHIIQEVIDNGADEALAGFATRISVTLLDDGGVVIEDNGRGIPVGLHPDEKVPVIEVAYTRLHAGGKFDKASGGAYSFSGGLHGVGVAVTTALSKQVTVQVKRGGKIHEMQFSDGGREIGQLQVVGGCDKAETGTKVTVYVDPSYFDSPTLPMAQLERLLRSKAAFLKNVRVDLTVEGVTRSWEFPGGIQQYLGELAGGVESVVPMYAGEWFVPADAVPESGGATQSSSFSPGEGAAFAFAWYAEGGVPSESYVNLIPTASGGTHVSGLRSGVFEAMKSFIDHHSLLPNRVRLQQEDVTSKMAFVLAAKVLDPQFQGQVKEKLNSREALRLVSLAVKDQFEVWLNANIESARTLAELAISAAAARQKSAAKVEKRKSSAVVTLPGKLTPCEAETDNEIFLVEGDSAGGSAKAARDKHNQAVLPLRGKILNSWEVESAALFTNQEIHDISVALGVDPHGPDAPPVPEGKDVLEGLRYSRVMVMTDADVDGSHIQTLILTLFYRHYPKLIERGHLYIVQPPLYRVSVGQSGKSKPRRFYALDDRERDSILTRLKQEKVHDSRIEVSRFKGLGEMNAEQLAETGMNPASRRALQVVFDISRAEQIESTFERLMHKRHADYRREWMELEGDKAELDV